MFGEIGRVEVSLISLILMEKINAGNEPSSIHFLPSKHKYWLKAHVHTIHSINSDKALLFARL